jgi:hypothetical protein
MSSNPLNMAILRAGLVAQFTAQLGKLREGDAERLADQTAGRGPEIGN